MTKDLTAPNEGFVLHTNTERNVFLSDVLLKWACLAMNIVTIGLHPSTWNILEKYLLKKIKQI